MSEGETIQMILASLPENEKVLLQRVLEIERDRLYMSDPGNLTPELVAAIKGSIK